MSECFKVDELMESIRNLSDENEGLRRENQSLLCQLEGVQKKLSEVSCVNTHLRQKLREKENLSVEDFMNKLSKNGAQGVLISFK